MYYLRTCAVTRGALRHAFSVKAVSVFFLAWTWPLCMLLFINSIGFIYIYVCVYVCVRVCSYVFIQ